MEQEDFECVVVNRTVIYFQIFSEYIKDNSLLRINHWSHPVLAFVTKFLHLLWSTSIIFLIFIFILQGISMGFTASLCKKRITECCFSLEQYSSRVVNLKLPLCQHFWLILYIRYITRFIFKRVLILSFYSAS